MEAFIHRSPVTDPLVIVSDGRELLRIHHDGSVTGAVEDASEAARIFIQELRIHSGTRA